MDLFEWHPKDFGSTHGGFCSETDEQNIACQIFPELRPFMVYIPRTLNHSFFARRRGTSQWVVVDIFSVVCVLLLASHKQVASNPFPWDEQAVAGSSSIIQGPAGNKGRASWFSWGTNGYTMSMSVAFLGKDSPWAMVTMNRR